MVDVFDELAVSKLGDFVNGKGDRMEDSSLSESTKVSLSVSSWLHVILLVITIVSCFFGLKSSIDEAIAQSAKNAQGLDTQQQSIIQLRMQLQQQSDDLKYFRSQYETDFNRYIRDHPGR